MDLAEEDAKLRFYLINKSDESVQKRKHARFPIHWRIALVHKNGVKNDIYHGRTHELSVSGASILVDHNIFVPTEVIVLLAIPPSHAGQKETIVEIHCSMVYTVLDSLQGRFRIGLHFLRFKADGKRILSDILSKRQIHNLEKDPLRGE